MNNAARELVDECNETTIDPRTGATRRNAGRQIPLSANPLPIEPIASSAPISKILTPKIPFPIQFVPREVLGIGETDGKKRWLGGRFSIHIAVQVQRHDRKGNVQVEVINQSVLAGMCSRPARLQFTLGETSCFQDSGFWYCRSRSAVRWGGWPVPGDRP